MTATKWVCVLLGIGFLFGLLPAEAPANVPKVILAEDFGYPG